LRRRFPEVVVEAGGVQSNRTTAGGPSLLDVSPSSVRAGANATITLRGRNLPSNAVVRVGNESLSGVLTDGPLQSLDLTVPARLIVTPGGISLSVSDPAAPQEPSSNPVTVAVEP
jgi:hypothetical protein